VRLALASPRPVPLAFSEKNGSNRRANMSGETPGPRRTLVHDRVRGLRRLLALRATHPKSASETQPAASNRTPSLSSRKRCSISAPNMRRRLIPPRALMTRCHGTVVRSGKALSA